MLPAPALTSQSGIGSVWADRCQEFDGRLPGRAKFCCEWMGSAEVGTKGKSDTASLSSLAAVSALVTALHHTLNSASPSNSAKFSIA